MAQEIEKQVIINPMDYGQLRNIAMEHIGRISSKYWTDHGIHDPGITMLEQLCFALVDLGYRTSFDIRDILTPEGCSQPQTKDSFILAEDILPCAPVTISDYKRLILQNMRGTVQNVQIDTEKKEFTLAPGIFKDKDKTELSVNGYYKVLIEPEGNPEDVEVSKIEELLLANRNICEHFTKPVVLSPLPVGIIADIELEPETDYRQVTKEIWNGVRKYITPVIPYHTLDELLSSGKAIDEILEGPVPPFDGDFVMEEDLPAISRRTELYVSDVKRIILETAGIRSIKHLNFYLPADDEDTATIVDGTLKLEPDAADTRYLTLQGLSFDGTDITRIVYEINGIPFELGRHLSCEPVMYKPNEAVSEIKAPVHIPIPEGRYRSLTMYRSPQNEMPEAYHVGKAGISPYETSENKAMRLQLKAYMSFFDQILSDYLEQLSSVGTLLSWKECDSTYFHHKLTDDEILDINKVLEEYEGYGLALDEKRAAQRKNAMLNHLLARFNETFVDYSILRYLQKPGSNAYDFSLKESVKDKKKFLSDYVGISARRSQGNPILRFNDEEGWKYSDVEMRVSRKLGIDNPPARLAPAVTGKSEEGAPIFEDNTNDDYNSVFGLHFIEHSLLVPNGNIIDAGAFLRLSTDELGETLAADPYSFQITAVLPGWLKISENGFFRDHVERIIREEIPAHVSVKVCWISMECMYGIENSYISLLSALAGNADTSGKLEKFIVAFATVRNIYPTSHIYSYDETLLNADQDDFTRLNFSAIGEAPTGYPEALELPENPSVREASTLKLKVRAIPEGTSLVGLEWTSSSRDVATVDKDGNVVGMKVGKSLITVTAAGGAKASCILSVTEMSLKELELRLSCSILSIPVGETDKIRVEIPDSVPTVFLSRILSGTFKSSDKSVATVDRNGFITMVSEGEAVISYVVPKYDFSIQCTVKSGKKEYVTVSNDDRSISLFVGETHKVAVKANRTDIPYDLVFVSADENIATVDANGVITAVSKGETRITADMRGQTNGTIVVFVYVSETLAGIKMDVKEIEVEPGVRTQVSAHTFPDNGISYPILFESSDPEIVYVENEGETLVNNYFKGLKPGTATITVRTVEGGFSDTCTVKVLGVDDVLEGIKMDEKEIETEVGILTKISAHTYPDNGKSYPIRFESSDPEIVYFENEGETLVNSYFKGLKPGTATVTVRTVDGSFTDTCTVKVLGAGDILEGVKMDEKEIEAEVGVFTRISAHTYPDDGHPFPIRFESSDPEIVYFEDDRDTIQISYFKGLKPGTATVTVRTVDGDFSDTCTVKVLGVDDILDGIKMDEKEIEAEVGVLTKISAHTYPDNGKSYPILFESSDPEIVCFEQEGETVVEDFFRGLKPGTATITVRTVDGSFSDTCTVKVLGIEDILEGIKMDVKEIEVEPGVLTQVSAHTFPDNGKSYLIRFESSDPEIVYFEDSRDTMVNDYFKGLKPGTAMITVRTVDGDFSDTCTVKVLGIEDILEGIKMDVKEIEVEPGVLTQVSAHTFPDNGKSYLIRFESSDPEIVYFEDSRDTMVNDYFKGLKPGTATITVRTVEGNFSDTCVVTVKGPGEGTKVRIMPEEPVALSLGASTKLWIETEGGDLNECLFRSSDPSVVKVIPESGFLEPVAEGSAIIEYGYPGAEALAKKTVTVVPKQVIIVHPGPIQIKLGRTLKLSIDDCGTGYDLTGCSFHTEDNAVVEINPHTNELIALSEGTAHITYSRPDGVVIGVNEIIVSGYPESELILYPINDVIMYPDIEANAFVSFTYDDTGFTLYTDDSSIIELCLKSGRDAVYRALRPGTAKLRYGIPGKVVLAERTVTVLKKKEEKEDLELKKKLLGEVLRFLLDYIK